MERILSCALVGVLIMVQACDKSGEAVTAPPADAQFLPAEFDAETLIRSVVGQSGAAREAAEAAVLGLWIPEPGWEGVVEQVTSEDGGTALRIYNYTTGIIGGGYWIIAIVPGPAPDVAAGDTVRVQGQIDGVGVLVSGASPAPAHRVILRDTILLKVRKVGG